MDRKNPPINHLAHRFSSSIVELSLLFSLISGLLCVSVQS